MTAPSAPPAQRRVHLTRGLSIGQRAVVPVLALISLVGLIIARVWPVQSVVSGDATCIMRILTGLPCPGCGMTRSWVHMAHGDVLTAFEYNVFGPLAMAAAAGLVIYTVVALVRRRPTERLFDQLNPKFLMVAMGLWLGYSVVRMVSIGIGQDYFALVVA
ncbi:MAG: DUF2752 domain-containing protein [Janibacter sp.]|uniref:DUF2752 domain-containing protein n=1 Tax=Janibacter limosus TaxID=53458 RepID=UPI00082A485D|nr:DUF2752 domain-containing protein [Janibacter limosus]MDN5717314.1 DUF2752 domain-containing protein [Janibacter sp.]